MQFRKRRAKFAKLDMTPMIDVVFLLIIFFMVSSTLVKTRGMAVKLPRATSSEAETKNQIVISITTSGDIYVNEDLVTLQSMGGKLKDLSLKLEQNVVIIKGDKTIPYDKMVQVMDRAKLAGMEKISLATTGK